jgi:hypothetical protein
MYPWKDVMNMALYLLYIPLKILQPHLIMRKTWKTIQQRGILQYTWPTDLKIVWGKSEKMLQPRGTYRGLTGKFSAVAWIGFWSWKMTIDYRKRNLSKMWTPVSVIINRPYQWKMLIVGKSGSIDGETLYNLLV